MTSPESWQSLGCFQGKLTGWNLDTPSEHTELPDICNIYLWNKLSFFKTRKFLFIGSDLGWGQERKSCWITPSPCSFSTAHLRIGLWVFFLNYLYSYIWSPGTKLQKSSKNLGQLRMLWLWEHVSHTRLNSVTQPRHWPTPPVLHRPSSYTSRSVKTKVFPQFLLFSWQPFNCTPCTVVLYLPSHIYVPSHFTLSHIPFKYLAAAPIKKALDRKASVALCLTLTTWEPKRSSLHYVVTSSASCAIVFSKYHGLKGIGSTEDLDRNTCQHG